MSNFLCALQKGCKKEQAVYEMDVWERVASACNYQLKSAPLIEEIAKVVIFGGPHEIIVRPKGDKNFVSEWGERRH